MIRLIGSGGLFLQLGLPVARLGFPIPFKFHFALDGAVRERARVFVGNRELARRVSFLIGLDGTSTLPTRLIPTFISVKCRRSSPV
jgi:hypothetical protein